MKKQIIALSVAVITSGSALAQDKNQWFVGADVGWDTRAFAGNADKYDKEASFAAKFGKYLGDEDQHRVYFTYGENKAGERGADKKAKDLLASYDYLYGLNADNSLRAFAGVTAGYSKVEFRDNGSKGDFAYGAQAGLNYQLTSNIELEGGYQYLKRDAKKDGIKMPEDNRLFIGANVKF